MFIEDLREIGRTQKPFGTKGYLRVYFNDELTVNLTKNDVIFMDEDGALIPFFVQDIVEEDSGVKVLFDEYFQLEEVRALSDKQMYIRKSDEGRMIVEDPFMQLDYDEILNYSCEDGEGILGSLVRIEAYPQQMMAIISCDDYEILIPLIKEYVVEINDFKKKIIFDLPDGLVDIQKPSQIED